jgi:hypothetical protein
MVQMLQQHRTDFLGFQQEERFSFGNKLLDSHASNLPSWDTRQPHRASEWNGLILFWESDVINRDDLP